MLGNISFHLHNSLPAGCRVIWIEQLHVSHRIFCEQFLVSALVNNFSLIHHKDMIHLFHIMLHSISVHSPTHSPEPKTYHIGRNHDESHVMFPHKVKEIRGDDRALLKVVHLANRLVQDDELGLGSLINSCQSRNDSTSSLNCPFGVLF